MDILFGLLAIDELNDMVVFEALHDRYFAF
jgi:hypothetical protein